MTGPEIVKFSAAVSSAFNSNELTRLLLGLNRIFLDYVTERAPFPDQVIELVAAAKSKGWIAQLVRAVVNDRPNNQFIRDFLKLYPNWDPAQYPPLEHPADTLLVFGGRSFVGRGVLREYLKKMDTRTGKKVLLVTSVHRKVGKTYSKDLIDFISADRQPSGVAYADLDTGDYDPIKLAKKLASEMGMNASLIPDEATEQASRSNQELVNLLIPNVTEALPKVWWIVLDGFRQQIPSEPIQDFIAQMAQRIQRMQDFRLILLNYGYCLPLAVDGFTFKDDLKPLTRDELKAHFKYVHTQKRGVAPSTEDLAKYLSGMDSFLSKYTQKHPESADDHLLLNMAVTDVADSI